MDVLLIEDDLDDIELLQETLKVNGVRYNLTTLKDGSEAVEFIRNPPGVPDIIILDYKLPDNKNGIEAAVKIFTTYPSAAILIVTAYDTVKEDVLRHSIFEGKRFAILLKPIKLARLENAIFDILKSK